MVQSRPAPATDASGPAADKRRREILAAASRLFRSRGLHATGMREIAAELGMTAGILYYYFPSKQDLLAFCQLEALGLLLELAEGVAEATSPVDEKLHRLIRGHVLVLNDSIPGSLAHLEVNEVPDARRGEILELRRRYEATYVAILEEGIASGALRPVDPRLATLALLGAINWTVQWFHEDGRKSARQVGDEFADLLVGGLRANGARAGGPA